MQVVITEKETGTQAVFKCSRWLSSARDDGAISRDLPAHSGEGYAWQHMPSAVFTMQWHLTVSSSPFALTSPEKNVSPLFQHKALPDATCL